ncbi:hypothetical protein K431DRAFT_281246 [Polychaeton citri CBS 116435]|uniref:Uncharacterized protein n=1 Tax=Polychaeton citri CBS 116435 TaxID=1314669 RepID=A0A9P4QFI1_9PEZI|nr:hypothetical protein K431DRAFT_281246 [Polychaeton citri CBS 116435]
MNGQPPNGSVYGSEVVHKKKSRSRRGAGSKRKAGFLAWSLDKALKLSVWYTLFVVLFRCPATEKDIKPGETSAICRPYFQARGYALPYARPYYDQYAAPYVAKTQPYVDLGNQRVYQPGLLAYKQYAQPHVQKVRDLAGKQWMNTVKPQLDSAQKQAKVQFDKSVAPHVQKVDELVRPRYESLKTSAHDIWELELQPVYKRTAPLIQSTYMQGSTFALDTAWPQLQQASNTSWSFFLRQIWPKLRVIYGENIEPQLQRITERLGRYKDGRKLSAEIKSMEASSKAAGVSSSASSVASEASAKASSAATATSSTSSSSSSTTPVPSKSAREAFEEDLASWEEVCSYAVSEGAEDLRLRVDNIAEDQINKSIRGTGAALVVQLEETSKSAIAGVKASILNAVSGISKDPTHEELDETYESLVDGIRNAGQSVKVRAQAVRDWHQSFKEAQSVFVEKALESTLETIDSIRDLRLHEIGRKYASAGLAHKDWSQYNELKKATKTWRDEVRKVIDDHKLIPQASKAALETEEEGMAIAEDTANELARLKEVAKWKVDIQDATDDFETHAIPTKINQIKEDVMSKAATAAAHLSETSEELAASALSAASSASSVASSLVYGSESNVLESATTTASSISSELVGSDVPVSEQVASSISSATSEVKVATASLGPEAASIVAAGKAKKDDAAESMASQSSSASDALSTAAESASSLADDAISSVKSGVAQASRAVNQESDFTDTLSEVTESASSIASQASKSALGESDLGDSLTDATSTVASAGAKASKKVFGGAMAQEIPHSSGPILDDIIDDTDAISERLSAIYSAAKGRAGELTQAVADAVKSGTSTQGTAESITSVANEQYESAISAASSVLFGTEKGNVEIASEAAREQYESAVTAASYAIYGTPDQYAALSSASSVASSLSVQATEASSNIADAAVSRYQEGVNIASKHYEAARSRLSVQISGTPEPIHKQMFASAESAYSDSVNAASRRLKDALNAMPTVPALSTAQGAYESMSSIASSRLSEGLAAASSQYDAAKLAVGVEPTPAHQQALASAQAAYYQGIGLAHARYDEFVSAASSVVGATPTPAYKSLLDSAQSSYSSAAEAAQYHLDALLASASSVVGATTTPVAQSVIDSASSQYDAAVAIASSQLALASEKASELIYGTQTGALESAASAASTAIIGTETPYYESMASQASENWDALISKASEQVYGQPAPFTDVVVSQAGPYAAQATEAAASQYAALQSLFSEAVSGREPDFTESVMNKLNSAYYTGVAAFASSASSYASGVYDDASSAITSVFTPPPTLEAIIDNASSQLDSMVEAASIQFYGSEKGSYEQATEAAAKAYGDAASAASEAVYGHETGYAEAAQSSLSAAAESASIAISEALFGTTTGSVESATGGAASAYGSVTSAAAEQAESVNSLLVSGYASVRAAVSSAVYGPEQGALESASARISLAMASAQSRIAEFGLQASSVGNDGVSKAGETYEQATSSISSAASVVTAAVRDEL